MPAMNHLHLINNKFHHSKQSIKWIFITEPHKKQIESTDILFTTIRMVTNYFIMWLYNIEPDCLLRDSSQLDSSLSSTLFFFLVNQKCQQLPQEISNFSRYDKMNYTLSHNSTWLIPLLKWQAGKGSGGNYSLPYLTINTTLEIVQNPSKLQKLQYTTSWQRIRSFHVT